MRVNKKALTWLAAGVVSVSLVAVWNLGQSESSTVTVKVLGYSRLSDTDSNDASPGTGIRAEVLLRNNGTASIRYSPASTASEPHGWVNARTPAGWIRAEIGSPSKEFFNLVRPGSNITFTVSLPVNTIEWKYGVYIRSASLRERAGMKMYEMNMWRFGALSRVVIRCFPHHPGPERELESDLFEVPAT
jgi:hypothetical protein